MNPCFKKLHAFMLAHDACTPAFAAVESAADWDELCAHPQAGEWAVWMAERLPALAPLWAGYEAKRAPLLAGYEAKRTSLRAEYEVKRASLWADCEAAVAPLQVPLIAPVRKEFEPAS